MTSYIVDTLCQSSSTLLIVLNHKIIVAKREYFGGNVSKIGTSSSYVKLRVAH